MITHQATMTVGAATIDEAVVAAFKSTLRGKLVTPEDGGYDEARKVYNGMIDKRPGLIARCVDVADVMSAVNFAREHNLTLAIRGGGHNGGGLGTCDDGLVIDLSNMKGVRVDPQARTAVVAGGCTWGEVDHATHVFGLATPSGIISTTGVGGLTLGGGIGHLTRKCGLSIVQDTRDAEIGKYRPAGFADQNVGAFDVAMNESLVVGSTQRLCHRLHPAQHLFDR